ncbi:hypothetical protein AAMO2058_000002300 [Amorphochlora amoebiformis]
MKHILYAIYLISQWRYLGSEKSMSDTSSSDSSPSSSGSDSESEEERKKKISKSSKKRKKKEKKKKKKKKEKKKSAKKKAKKRKRRLERDREKTLNHAKKKLKVPSVALKSLEKKKTETPSRGFLDFLPPLSTGSKKGLKGESLKFRGWSHHNSYDPKMDPKKPKETNLHKHLKASFKKDIEDRKKGIIDVVEKGFRFQ